MNETAADDEKRQSKTYELSEGTVKGVDDFIELGWYTLLICIGCELHILSQVCTMMFMIHAGAPPRVLGCGDTQFNETGVDWCEQLSHLRQNTGCIPQLDYQFYSVNVEFDRLCSDEKDVKNSISIQMLGVLIGASIFGQISDSFGRKRTMILCMSGMIIFGYVTATAQSLLIFTFWRSVIGFFCGGHIAVLYVYMLEQLPRKHSFWIAGVVTWSPNYIFLALLSYYSHDWRTYSKMISYIEIPALIFLFFLCESPRWLMQKGKFTSAKKAIKFTRYGLKDGPEIDLQIDQMIEKEAELQNAGSKKAHYFYHLFRTKKLTTYALILAYGYFLMSIINYALMFNLGSLTGSIYWNSAMLGILRWTANIAAGILGYSCKFIGRKVVQFATTALIVVSLIITFVIYAFDAVGTYKLVLRLSTLTTAALTSQGFITKNVVVVEVFPTAIRNIATSFMGVTSRVGSMLAPQIFLLGTIWPALPYLSMIMMAFIELFGFQLLIPETRYMRMVDQLPEKTVKAKKKIIRAELGSCEISA